MHYVVRITAITCRITDRSRSYQLVVVQDLFSFNRQPVWYLDLGMLVSPGITHQWNSWVRLAKIYLSALPTWYGA